MVNVRGVNVYPSAVEAVVRSHREVVEFRSVVTHAGALASLAVEVEVREEAGTAAALIVRLGAALREALGLTVPVTVVEAGTLPRFEMKARRFVVQR
jgi:phenylacetate-CoA ligase